MHVCPFVHKFEFNVNSNGDGGEFLQPRSHGSNFLHQPGVEKEWRFVLGAILHMTCKQKSISSLFLLLKAYAEL